MLPLSREEGRTEALVVLVVDDNVDAAVSLSCLLQLLECKTVVAYDGPTAVDVAVLVPPQLAFIDLDLPGFDGCEVLRRLKAADGLGPAVSVCLTGRGGPHDRLRCLEAGFDDFLSKPLELADLNRALQQAREAVATSSLLSLDCLPGGCAGAALALGDAGRRAS
ncbi:response regulator [Eleftheria terrae]|uniref:response regulator n=1 Tax=Eleftheria terrae TaxID=1597781 RepID=UPI00263A5BA7|nr:response regulator [Eleftheria terrae]WKB50696.1 response regulator [Eleftheria terrae]